MNREKVLNYIDAATKLSADKEADRKYLMSDQYLDDVINKMKPYEKEYRTRSMICDIYKDAVPMNQEMRDCCAIDLRNDMDNFIDKQCPDGELLQYITDSKNCAMKKPAMECEKAVDRVYREMKEELRQKRDDMGVPLSSSDIGNSQMNAQLKLDKEIDQIAQKANFSELSTAIESNVADAVKSSVESAKEIKMQNKEFEDGLVNDLSKTTVESVQEEIAIRQSTMKHSYNLFEAIFASKLDRVAQESVEDENPDNIREMAMFEAVKEYTKLSVWKALRMQTYGLPETKRLINSYLGE